MMISLAKIYPEEELLCDLYHRMKDNFEYFLDKHPDVTISIKKNKKEGYLMIKTLTLGEQVN